MKKVFKYATGQDIPNEAIYLWSCVQETESGRLVWHYYELSQVKE